MASDPIYLDYNATTPIDPDVAEAMLPYLHRHFGNPSSSHAHGITVREAVDSARLQVADLLGAEPEEIVFTSGGTESNNMVIQGLARRLASQGRHIITSAVEHPAVLEPCYALEKDNFCVTILPVDGEGRVSPETVAQAITSETTLISIMHANNEVGTLQPMTEILQCEPVLRIQRFLHGQKLLVEARQKPLDDRHKSGIACYECAENRRINRLR